MGLLARPRHAAIFSRAPLPTAPPPPPRHLPAPAGRLRPPGAEARRGFPLFLECPRCPAGGIPRCGAGRASRRCRGGAAMSGGTESDRGRRWRPAALPPAPGADPAGRRPPAPWFPCCPFPPPLHEEPSVPLLPPSPRRTWAFSPAHLLAPILVRVSILFLRGQHDPRKRGIGEENGGWDPPTWSSRLVFLSLPFPALPWPGLSRPPRWRCGVSSRSAAPGGHPPPHGPFSSSFRPRLPPCCPFLLPMRNPGVIPRNILWLADSLSSVCLFSHCPIPALLYRRPRAWLLCASSNPVRCCSFRPCATSYYHRSCPTLEPL